MFSGAYGPGTPYEELEQAHALAVDMGAIEDDGREQVGDLHGLLSTFYEVNRQIEDCLRFRILRRVISETSPWRGSGEIVDTTGYDNQFVAFRAFPTMQNQNYNDWHFKERTSPAILVMENAYQDGENGTIILPPKEARFPVLPRLREGINNEISWILVQQGLLLMQPSLALPKLGMTPVEILNLMTAKRVLSSLGEVVMERGYDTDNDEMD